MRRSFVILLLRVILMLSRGVQVVNRFEGFDSAPDNNGWPLKAGSAAFAVSVNDMPNAKIHAFTNGDEIS
jgi:hypothetical protein